MFPGIYAFIDIGRVLTIGLDSALLSRYLIIIYADHFHVYSYMIFQYCSGRCQRRHWSRHRIDCEHPYMATRWEPEWMAENRQPLLSNSRFLPSSSSTEVYKNLGVPAYDCLNLLANEGIGDPIRNIKICMTCKQLNCPVSQNQFSQICSRWGHTQRNKDRQQYPGRSLGKDQYTCQQ